MVKNYNIIRPANIRPLPDKYEERVAELCAEYFKSDVAFVIRGTQTTPDIQVLKTKKFWEIKSIKGKGKHMIENNLRRASKQSENVIISLLKLPKISDNQAIARVKYILRTTNIIVKHVLVVTRDEKIVDIK